MRKPYSSTKVLSDAVQAVLESGEPTDLDRREANRWSRADLAAIKTGLGEGVGGTRMSAPAFQWNAVHKSLPL